MLQAPACLAVSADWSQREFVYRRKALLEDPAGASVCHARFSHHGLLRADGGDIRVTDSAGKLLNHELLRLGPGDQAEILFECPGAKAGSYYWIYFGNANAPALGKVGPASAPAGRDAGPTSPWKAEAGVVLEIRKKGAGGHASWGDFQKLYAISPEIIGRTLRSKVFDAVNPLGPSVNYISYYRAHFRAEKAGPYRFATRADDVSFLLVDGKLITESHDGGEHAGAIDLKEGVHKLEYYHAQGDGGTATVAAWQRPGEKWPVLMDNNAFLPIARAKTQAIERISGQPVLDFQWSPRDHLVVNGRFMIRYVFNYAAPAGALRWDFGDSCILAPTGTEAGPAGELAHGFLAPGTYTVTLSAGGSSLKQTVVVEPLWLQKDEWDDTRWQQYRPGVLARLEAGSLSPTATATALVYAAALDDKKLLEAGAAMAWKQAKTFSPAEQQNVFTLLAQRLQSDLKNYTEAEHAYREVIAGPGEKQFKERARLHRAGLLIHKQGKDREGLDALKEIDDTGLTPDEALLKQVYIADAFAGLGMREEAAKRYQALRPVVNLTSRTYAVARRGRLLSINTWIRKGDFESALKELGNIEWETPQERMDDETGMLRAECYLAQQDWSLAVIVLQRLLKVNPASARVPEMLFILLKAYRGMNNTELVDETFAKLKKQHPYAAETALAAAFLGK